MNIFFWMVKKSPKNGTITQKQSQSNAARINKRPVRKKKGGLRRILKGKAQ